MPVRRHPIAQSRDPNLLDPVPLDHELIARLRETYQRVRQADLQLARLFYRRLFAARPELRSLFPADLESQAQKLIASLDAVVENLERPAENAGQLAELGLRHDRYGARPEHYSIVVDLLVDSMRELLQATASAPALEDWRTALQLVSAQMLAAAASPRAGRPA